MARNPVPHDKAFVSFEKKEIEQSITERFEKQVKKYPERLAVKTKNTALTYEILNGFANRVARSILNGQAGDQKEPCVLLLDQGIPLIAAILGTLKAGKIYLALDSHYPDKSNTDIVKVSGAQLIITDLKNLNRATRIAGNKVEILNVGELEESTDLVENPRLTILPKMPAYIFYTSGTTGQRKGVVDCHQNILHNIMRYTNSLGIHQHDKLTLIQSASFSGSVSSLFAALLNGACVFPIDLRQDGLKYLVDTMQKEGITIFHSVPSIFRHVASEGKHFPALRLIRLEGDQATLKDVELYRKNFFDDCILVNGFGATECGIARQFFIDKNTTLNTNTVPVGFKVQDMETLILDGEGNLVAPNSVGELVIRSQYLASGYWKNDELTEKYFYGEDENGLRLYKTGDLARISEEGCLEHMGRIDNQVKIRGFRIELGEIEAVLNQHPGVKQVVVLAREDEPGNKRLVAYIVSEKGHNPLTSELRDFLKKKLPEYMIPSVFIKLDSLPLTPNGKVDRKALPAPDQKRPELEKEFVAPGTPTEIKLAEIWCRLLNLKEVGVNDNFFELGGHSLLATQLISMIEDAFQVDIPLRKVFEMPTVCGLAESVTSALQSDSYLQAPPLKPVLRHEKMSLSFAQQRLWFLDQLEQESSFYNLSSVFRLTGDLDVPVLHRSLNAIVSRYETLRTLFRSEEGLPFQVIQQGIEIDLPVVDLTKFDESKRESEFQSMVMEEAQRPFKLSEGPLIRCALLRFDDSDHVLLLTMHHIISDGWSMGIFKRELSAFYNDFVAGHSPTLGKLPIQYADFANWQREWLKGEALEKQLSYWKKHLEGAPSLLELPTDLTRPVVQSYRGARESIILPYEFSEAIKSLSRSERSTPFMTMLAVFKVLLYRYTGVDDILLGTPIANRTRMEIENLIGFFVNTLVLRSDLSGNPSFREFLHRVREVALEAYAHQDLPFEKLVKEMHPERSLNYSPLFQVMFAYQNAPSGSLEMSNLTLTTVEVDSKISKFDLTLIVNETDQSFRVLFEYNTGLFNQDTIIRMLGHFKTLLESIADDPDNSISTLPILTKVEQDQMLFEWNSTKTDFLHNKCIHQLFEMQVEKSPDTVAVVYEDDQLTYRELNEQSNQLAHYLRKQGVGPDVLVGICIERSIELIVSLLGILKAGGAYIPLDPSYPEERIKFMIDDSNSGILLTTNNLLKYLPENNIKKICLDNEWNLISEYGTENISNLTNTDSLAYIIYTSGSKGVPKGVAIEHKSVVNQMYWRQDQFELNRNDVILQKASYSFDVSVWEFFLPLMFGARASSGQA